MQRTRVLMAAAMLTAAFAGCERKSQETRTAVKPRLVATAAAQPAPGAGDASRKTPEADDLLRAMGDYLGGLQSFGVKAEHATEVVLDSGQKLQLGAAADVFVKRPNQLRSDRTGELATVTLYYDGKDLTVYAQQSGFYASAAAPPTIDTAIDFAREKIGVELPAADLVHSDPYTVLTEDVIEGSGRYIGMTEIRGVRCHHLAFRGNETDWQIWIEDSERPLPRRYVITSKKIAGAPEFSVDLYDWDVDLRRPADFFTFVPPEGAERIEFLALTKDKVRNPDERRRP